MSRSDDSNWPDPLADRPRYDLVRDAIAKELARTYGSIVTDPLPGELARALNEQREADKDRS